MTTARTGVVAAVVAFLLSALAVLASPAAWAAETVQLAVNWTSGTSSTISNGNAANLEVKIAVNDEPNGAAGSQTDLTFTVTSTHGVFNAKPAACPGANTAISADSLTLTCDAGTVAYGTAVRVQVPVTASGANKDQVLPTVTVTNPAKSVASQSPTPLTISATGKIDMWFNQSETGSTSLQAGVPYTTDAGFYISVPVGGEQLKNTVSFDLTVKDNNDNKNAPLASQVVSPQKNPDTGNYCWPTNLRSVAVASVWNLGTNAQSPMPTTCSITKTGTGVYHVTLSGFQTDFGNTPTTNGSNQPLPATDVFLSSGFFRFGTGTSALLSTGQNNVDFDIVMSNVSATTASGAPATEIDSTNQTENRKVVTGTSFSAKWYRDAGLVGQSPDWSDQAATATGIMVHPIVGTTAYVNRTNYTTGGLCLALDTHSVYEGIQATSTSGAKTSKTEYYTKAISDPTTFDCAGTSGWTTTPPSDLSTVHAMRLTWAGGSNIDTTDPTYGNGAQIELRTHAVNSLPGNTKVTMAGYQLSSDGKTWVTKPAALTDHTADNYYITASYPVAKKTVDKTSAKPGDTLTYTITGTLATGAITTVTGTEKLVDTLPAGLTYVSGSASVTPTSVSGQTLTWDKQTVTLNTGKVITFKAKIASPAPSASLTNSLTVYRMDADTRIAAGELKATATANTILPSNGETDIQVKAKSSVFPVNGTNAWLVTLTNSDTATQSTWDEITILPYNGDSRGSSFHGSYTIGTVDGAGGTVYYTTTDPSKLSYDPAAAANGAFGSPSSIWTTTKPANPTAIRVVGSNLGSAAQAVITIPWTPAQSQTGDTYNAIGAARMTTTTLRMVLSNQAVVKVENSNLKIHKVTSDQPVIGGTMSYTVTVLNSGTDAANDVVVHEMPGANLDADNGEWTVTQGDIDDDSGDWDVGVVPAGGTVTATYTVPVADDAVMSTDVVNQVQVYNPSHQTTSTCTPNATVQADTDQCDQTSTGWPRHALSGTVYTDTSWDGTHDPGEPGVSGDTVTLTLPDGSTQTTTTNASGFYQFTGLLPGDYHVTLIDTSGRVLTQSYTVSDPTGQATTMTVGSTISTSDITGVDFGLIAPVTMTTAKTDMAGADLDGAQFTITPTSGVTFPDGSTDAETMTPTSGHQFVSGGLLAGQPYQMIETKAPAGYELLAEPIVFTVDPDGTVTIVSGSSQMVKVPAGTPNQAQVGDAKATQLPTTGGDGADTAAWGVMLVLAAGVVYQVKRSRPDR